MKKTSKLLCMLMAVVMIFSLCACNSGNNGGKNTSSRATVEGFLNAICEMKLDEALTYVDTDEDLFKDIPTLEELKEELSGQMENVPAGMEGLKDVVIGLIESMYNKMIDTIGYEIGECKENGDTHTYDVKITMADFSKLDDMESLIGEELYGEIMGELFKIGLAGDVENSEEALTELYSSMAEKFDEVLTEAINNCEKTEHEMEIDVVNKDGKWLVSAGEAFNGFGTIFGSIKLPQ